jgi:AcrR family transcriptional regulator
MAETKRRIAQAAVELHASIGPSNTTISAIADRAGVQRLTIYRHFPDERSLFDACVQHGLALMPLPDPARWRKIEEPEARLRAALAELYGYFRRSETMWAHVLPDLPKLPALLEANAPVFERWGEMRTVLSRGWGRRGSVKREVEAMIALALDFHNWQTLVRDHDFSHEKVVDLFVRSIRCVAKQTNRR